jgi:hypothetical protein
MVRILIPVVTNEGIDFRLNGTRVVMPAGSRWHLRLCDPHSVANRGRQRAGRVIPVIRGRKCTPADPESIVPAGGYGFRARRHAAPRNDGVVDSSGQFC